MDVEFWGDEDLQAQSAAELLGIVRDGGELVVDNSEVAQSLVECGFEIIRTKGDNGTEIVLQVRGEYHNETSEKAKPRPPPAQGTTEFSEKDSANFKRGPVTQNVAHLSPSSGTSFKINSPEAIDAPGCKRYVQRSRGDQPVAQEVYAFLRVTPAYLRNPATPATQEVTLMLEEAVFGVLNCLKEVRCLGHFVHRLDIEVCPSDSWKSLCTLGTVRPGNAQYPSSSATHTIRRLGSSRLHTRSSSRRSGHTNPVHINLIRRTSPPLVASCDKTTWRR